MSRASIFLDGLERQSLRENIIEALTVSIPRLYELEFEDFDSDEDLPAELYRLIDVIERDLGIDLAPE